MRRHVWIDVPEGPLAASLDLPADAPRAAMLIVSGGNELRAGAFAGQARLAAELAARGYAVLRFDAPGVGDSPGDNGGFATRGPALAAAREWLRREIPDAPLLLFGNCDGASLIALAGGGLGASHWLLANPWTIETESEPPPDAEEEPAPASPSAAAIRARYLARLARPDRLLADLFSGRIDLGKLVGGLRRLHAGDAPSALADRLGEALAAAPCPVTLLVAARDGTALAFLAHWRSAAFAAARAHGDIALESIDSASHGFADAAARRWLVERLADALNAAAINSR